ncbi:MAG: VRR-NUC domain-containing protein [Cellulomonas sp.]|uniref:VRR-NUC domain-containing protein n=1 Tax=Cellulomonas sp. TaxID=40001 RepID=UPI002583E081|nr:VRR-NUC domain-containing protein [Cellulomonas sp.]MCR6706570.1 VRR-NUC domain-containing protein [Cellulomonas sp.]
MTAPRSLTPQQHRALVAEQMTESALQAQILTAARTTGWLAYHTHDSRRSRPGFPDLVLVHDRRGLVLFRELKTERGRVRPEQREWLSALAAAGADAGVWRPSDWLGERVIAELMGTPS